MRVARWVDRQGMIVEEHVPAMGRQLDRLAEVHAAQLLIQRPHHLVSLKVGLGQLPKLAAGPFAGYPRVLGVAWAFVAHTDSRFDPEMLCRYIAAYQQIMNMPI